MEDMHYNGAYNLKKNKKKKLLQLGVALVGVLKLQYGNLMNKKGIVQFPTVSYRFMIPSIDFLHQTDLINDNKHTMISSAQRMPQKRTHEANRCRACSFPSLSSLFVPRFSLRLMITNLP